MTYSEAIQFLYNLRLFGAKFGLDNTLKLSALVGNPERDLRFIHVAGTNGKGSTCAMLESVYRAAGLRVGLFTSPHLVSFGERFQINRQLIPESDVIRLVASMQALLHHFPSASHPTFFEVITVMALCYFAEKGCDLVVWETGLGGRLDATNIVTPLASVITNVQFDHQQWLGDTLSRIAAEKAGIIKTGVPVLTAADDPSALRVIQNTASERQAPLTVVSRADTQRPPLCDLRLPLLGEHQRLNAALALATVRALQPELGVTEEAIRSGLLQVDWAGRLQLVKAASGQTFLLDGAHNPAGADTLRAAFQKFFPGVKPALILGILRDKDWRTMCETLAPLAGHIVIAPVHCDRSAPPEALREVCHQVNPAAKVTACSSLVEALTLCAEDTFVVVAGSLYLIGELMEMLKWSPCLRPNERGLNEWSTPSTVSSPCCSPA